MRNNCKLNKAKSCNNLNFPWIKNGKNLKFLLNLAKNNCSVCQMFPLQFTCTVFLKKTIIKWKASSYNFLYYSIFAGVYSGNFIHMLPLSRSCGLKSARKWSSTSWNGSTLTLPSTNLSVQRTALSISPTELKFHMHERSSESARANYNQVPWARKRECFCCTPGQYTFQHMCCSFIKGNLTRDFRL